MIYNPSNTDYKFASKTFTGIYNGQNAELSVDMYEGYLLKVGDSIVLNVSGSSVRNQKYGGVDYKNNEVLIIDEGSNNEAPISFKFKFDLDNFTFVSSLYQSKGKGRNVRKWESTKGNNLLFSYALRLSCDTRLSLLWAAATSDSSSASLS